MQIDDFTGLIKEAGGKWISDDLLQKLTAMQILPGGSGQPSTEPAWTLDVGLAVQDGGYLGSDLVWNNFALTGHVALTASVERDKQPFFQISTPPIPIIPGVSVWTGVGFGLTGRVDGTIDVLPSGELDPASASITVAPEFTLSLTADSRTRYSRHRH